jgi:hypothetical protein
LKQAENQLGALVAERGLVQPGCRHKGTVVAMIIALAVLAALMVACGAAALVSGWDVVLTERGWTQVIAGATGLTGGLVLIGVTCVAAELKRLRRDITAAVMDVSDDEPNVTANGGSAAVVIGPAATAALAGALAADAAAARESTTAPVHAGPRESGHADMIAYQPADEEPEAAIDHHDRDGEHVMADLSPTEEQISPPTAPHEPSGADIDAADRVLDQNPPPPDPGPPVTLPPDTLAPDTLAPETPQVIGTYASAGITYYMFSDDSIEAEMEQGRFRFENMDDLRQFLETGDGGLLVAAADEDAPMST